MAKKLVSNLSLKEIMGMSENDIASLNRDDVVREIRLQFSSAHAEVKKRLGANKKKLQDILMNMEHFDINALINIELSVENEEKILGVMKKRFTILFPDQKIDILE